MTCSTMTDMKCLWMLSPGSSIGAQDMEFDDSLKWIAKFLKYLCGFTTQEEEDWFDGRCNALNVDLTSSSTATTWDVARSWQMC